MKHPITLELHLPDNVYLPEFLRRVVAFVQLIERRLANPSRWTERSQVAQAALDMLLTPRCVVEMQQPLAWAARLELLPPVATLTRGRVFFELPADIDPAAFQRRCTDLFDELEISMVLAVAPKAIDQTAVTRKAWALLETPRQFMDTVASEVGHVVAY